MTPDARLFFASSVHSRAYAHLMYGLEQREGFVVVTGEVGAGKTTLIDRFCTELDPNAFLLARIVTTQVTGDDLLRLVADAFGASADGDKAAVLRGIIAALRTPGRRHVLIIDEAQGLSPQGLEELRMLSNVTDGTRALLQTILLGQPELQRTIASPSLSQLRQRILACFHLSALSRDETRDYVEHRLRAVGWDGQPSWEDTAFNVIYRHSGGIPRRINRLCSRVLLSGALEQALHLTTEMVEVTAAELEADLGIAPVRDAVGARNSMFLTSDLPLDVEVQLDDISRRVDMLERTTERRERVFRRLMDLLAEPRGGR